MRVPGRCRGAVTDKSKYVRKQVQTRPHTCHWPGCDKQVPPAMWGCRIHWLALPVRLRRRIWSTYQIGQESTMTPSREYLEAAEAANKWISDNQTSRTTTPDVLRAALAEAEKRAAQEFLDRGDELSRRRFHAAVRRMVSLRKPVSAGGATP